MLFCDSTYIRKSGYGRIRNMLGSFAVHLVALNAVTSVQGLPPVNPGDAFYEIPHSYVEKMIAISSTLSGLFNLEVGVTKELTVTVTDTDTFRQYKIPSNSQTPVFVKEVEHGSNNLSVEHNLGIRLEAISLSAGSTDKSISKKYYVKEKENSTWRTQYPNADYIDSIATFKPKDNGWPALINGAVLLDPVSSENKVEVLFRIMR